MTIALFFISVSQGFSLLFDAGFEVGRTLVADQRIRAVAFTGSRRGGTALMEIASRRKQPIPVYAEMISINPVVLFPGALKNCARDIASSFVTSLVLGAGQFCTNPGLLLAVGGEDLETSTSTAAALLPEVDAQPMLTPSIAKAYFDGVRKLERHPEVKSIASGRTGSEYEGAATLCETTAEAFLAHHELQDRGAAYRGAPSRPQ